MRGFHPERQERHESERQARAGKDDVELDAAQEAKPKAEPVGSAADDERDDRRAGPQETMQYVAARAGEG